LQYGEKIENFTLPSQTTLANTMNLRNIEGKVIDMACGTGVFGSIHSLQKSPKQKFYMMDLSDEMINFSKKRLYRTLTERRLFLDIQEFADFNSDQMNDQVFVKNSINCQQADACKLPFADGEIDAYLCGLALHLVPEPELVLQEAFRVLKSGGKLGFSVFGKKSKSQFFNLFDSLMRREGVMEYRSKFHMDDEAKVRLMLEESGFKNVRFMRQDIPFDEDYCRDTDGHFKMPANRAMLKGFSTEKINALREELRGMMADVLEKEHVGVENLLITADKP
jgi:ubiquinone/menaquinone biosynthesis C-methylase UbiE